MIKHISPMLAAANMSETLAFYREILGFRVMMETPGYSIIERDGQTIHIAAPATEEALSSMRKHTSIYIEVVGLAGLWEQVKQSAKGFRVREPFERPYGMREFHIIDPNGCLIFVGEPTEALRIP